MGQNFATTIQYPGGRFPVYNITAATLIKATPGCLYRVVVTAPGTTGGALVLSDSNNLAGSNTITAITAAANAVVTISTGGSTNPFAVGNSISFVGASGMTQINGLIGTVTAIGGVTTAWTVTTSINSSAFTAWTSGGTCGNTVANQIQSVAFGSLSIGQVINLDWQTLNGIAVTAVPTAGSPIYTLEYL